ncbi:EamA family transporter [Desulfoluna sp.]|uniref:DMT family transporter n=1 Tax=Desulfoluna sp. TaxID=2045199 RepID=UPI002603A499|nr:EamA family transporter [Desulfoluna sp.]
MRNVLFYLMTILIWGSTWLAITFQLGSVDPMVSVAYRFSLATVLLLLWCWVRRLRMRFTMGEHLAMATQGVFLFGVNYWLFYLAELHIASGLAAVIFSTVMVMNVINGAIFLKSPIDMKVVAGGALGLVGIGLVFQPELTSFHLGDSGAKGLLFCFVATYLASIGNILSARNQAHGLPVVQTNAYGMMYGALLMLGLSAILGRSFVFEVSGLYVGAMVYLAVFGSIVAFGCYLSLVGRIGADRAAYATLVFPVVALVISTIWEGYQWSTPAFCGVALILLGNLLLLNRKAGNKKPEELHSTLAEPVTDAN